jgi:hypothetical protein
MLPNRTERKQPVQLRSSLHVLAQSAQVGALQARDLTLGKQRCNIKLKSKIIAVAKSYRKIEHALFDFVFREGGYAFKISLNHIY